MDTKTERNGPTEGFDLSSAERETKVTKRFAGSLQPGISRKLVKTGACVFVAFAALL